MMATWQDHLRKLAIAGGIAGAALGISLAGCSEKPAPGNAKVEVGPNVGEQGGAGTPQTGTGENSVEADVNFNQTFEQAAITEVLEGHQFPPDVTLGGKKSGPLRVEIESSWSKVKLVDSSAKPIRYTLQLDTSLGAIEIKLRPEIAPNHVRNIIALTHAGYYDGLQFERVIHQQSEIDGQKTRLDMVLAGCPTGTGDDGLGHIGYFLRSEFQQNLKHEEGTVGFWHEENPDSAGCRFYITLGPAPLLDGKFTIIGSVSKGLDVVKKIAEQPLQSADVPPENEKPVTPTGIKKAIIVPEAMEKTVPVAQNERSGN